jgi:hypothetical protein
MMSPYNDDESLFLMTLLLYFFRPLPPLLLFGRPEDSGFQDFQKNTKNDPLVERPGSRQNLAR